MEYKPVHITADGLRKLEEEYNHLITARRDEVAERIRASRDFGDISENAEYIEAKNEQSLLEGRIQTLLGMLRNAVRIDDAERDQGVIDLGASVKVRLEDGDETYAIVGPVEADPLEGRISNESPLGSALVGHRAGDVVEWRSPTGSRRVEVLAVS